MHTQLAILGGGPGGYAAAFLAADQGLETTLIEADSRLGGTCLLRGCIPSKALLHVARVMSEVEELRENWGVEYGQPKIDIEKIRQQKEKLIQLLSGGLKQLAKRRKVKVITARGVLENSTTLRTEGGDSSIPAEGKITFDRLILATGSSPAAPAALRIDSPRVMTSSEALELAETPSSLLVVGGGYIGLELGTVYARLGSEVSVVEMTDGLLPEVDRDLVKPLQKRLSAVFQDRIHLSAKIASLADCGDYVEAVIEEQNASRVERYDRVLIAIGRRPNSQGLGLENTQVEIDSQGFIICDQRQQTSDPNILAVGDVAGQPMLAHKATHDAKIAVQTASQSEPENSDAVIPAVVFTDPEIAWAGLTEQQAKQQQREYQAALYPWAASGRAYAIGRTEGLTKWLIDPQTDRVLGCGIVGAGAGELIAEAVLAIEKKCKINEIAAVIHPHPTLSETLANAADVYLGSAIEIYKPRRTRASK